MGTINAMIIICFLIISAAVTVIIILATMPAESTYESHFSELWINRIPVDIRYDTKKTPYNLNNDVSQNLPVIATRNIASENTTIAITAITTTTANTTTTVTTAAIDRITLPNIAETVKYTFENVNLPYQSSTIVPATVWKLNRNKLPQRSSIINLSASITVTEKKRVTQSDRRSSIKSQHHSTSSNAVTPQNLRQNLAALILHQHIEQLPLHDDNLVNNRHENEQVAQMTLLNEVTFPHHVKVIGLAMYREILYVATNDGRITMINPETSEQLETLSVDGKISRMTVTYQGDIIILNGSKLLSYRDGQKYREMNLPIAGKSLSAFKNEEGLEGIIALGQSGDVLFVFTNDLEPIEELFYKNDIKETCNFAILHQKYYYISCQSAILQLSEDGEIMRRIGVNNGTFSLGINVDDEGRLIAIVRGQPLLRVFQVMKQSEISPKAITELIQFLSPNINHSLRQQALDYVIGLSASDQFNVIFQANDFLLGRPLCQLVCDDKIDGSDVLPALINATATDIICAKYVLDSIELIQRCIEYCRDGNERRSLNAAKLLSNLSLHYPDTKKISESLSDSSSNENTDYLGYVLVNLTSIANVRCLLCEKFVRQLLPLVDCDKRSERCLIAIDILRNICFENSYHPLLLDKKDEFLSTLVRPLADVNDNLEDVEIEKLPLQLQYYEGHRCQDLLITNKIIESLYQVISFSTDPLKLLMRSEQRKLCGSEVGLKTLRIKGVYALLREFDRASIASKKNSLVASSSMIPVTEGDITNNHSQTVMHDGKDLQVGSTVHSDREMIARTADTQDIKFLGETGNLIYIDGQNCSTLHALIGLLIQD